MTAPADLAGLLQQASDLLRQRAFAEADALCRLVLQRFGDDANALMIMGLARMGAGDVRGATACLERARAINPRHVHVLNNLGNAYRAQGRLAEAKAALEAAVRLDGRMAAACNNLGNVCLDMEQREAARGWYERTLALEPEHADAAANLARLHEEAHALADAAALARRALARVPGHLQAGLTLARVEQRMGDPAAALARLEVLLGQALLTENLRTVAQGYRGECLERLGRFGEAFAAFGAANDLQLAAHRARFGSDAGFLSTAHIAQQAALLRDRPAGSWSTVPAATREPVFLVGFPRSGTTLLDQILSSHPEVTVLEERETLGDVCRQMFPGQDVRFWADMADFQIEQMRQLYWAQVDAGLGGVAARRVFIDKLPLNAALLPLIHRLFPSARIILALRDPRDVVLSCFQQRFGMNGAMYQMLRTESAAEYYDRVMSLVAQARAALALRVQEVRYEDVISDFEGQVRSLLSFLGLGWDERVRDHAATARGRVIRTPSATQVVAPLYASSIGKWRNYRAELAPVLPRLASWVAAFGYPPD